MSSYGDPADRWRCPNCEIWNSNEALYCRICGEKQPEPVAYTWQCPDCGAWNEEKDTCCSACGIDRTLRDRGWTCKKCNARNKDGDSVCASCGSTKEGQIYTWQCQYCNTWNPENYSFCSKCKKSRKADSPPWDKWKKLGLAVLVSTLSIFLILIIITQELPWKWIPDASSASPEPTQTPSTRIQSAHSGLTAPAVMPSLTHESSSAPKQAIDLYFGDTRYNAGYWSVPVLQTEERISNCTGFTFCFGYKEVDDQELGEQRVYVCLNENNSAWLEYGVLNVTKEGEVYRMDISFDKPRTIGGIAVLSKQATENGYSVMAWIENPVYSD